MSVKHADNGDRGDAPTVREHDGFSLATPSRDSARMIIGSEITKNLRIR
jgi:hypothetical protein